MGDGKLKILDVKVLNEDNPDEFVKLLKEGTGRHRHVDCIPRQKVVEDFIDFINFFFDDKLPIIYEQDYEDSDDPMPFGEIKENMIEHFKLRLKAKYGISEKEVEASKE